MHHTGYTKNCGNTCNLQQKESRFPWMFRPFLVIGPMSEKPKCGNYSQDIFLLFSRWGRRAIHLSSSSKHNKYPKGFSQLQERDKCSLLGCVFHLSHFAVMTSEILIIALHCWKDKAILQPLTYVHPSFEEAQALAQAFPRQGWIHSFPNAIDKDIHSQHPWVTFKIIF